jgi:hypothetical protein
LGGLLIPGTCADDISALMDQHESLASAVGTLHDKTLSDIVGNCSAVAYKWEYYITLAVRASVEDVFSQGQIKSGQFSISRTSWQWPS